MAGKEEPCDLCGTRDGVGFMFGLPAAKYSSTVSQADADAKATVDINSNGQAYANANGTCSKRN